MLKKVQKYLNYPHKKKGRVEWEIADDVKNKISELIRTLDIDWIDTSRIFCFRSFGSRSYARARIWGLPKIWQKALTIPPAYILEVLSEKFDGLTKKEKEEVLLHEIAHIPKNFSGALVPHYRKGRRKFKDKVRLLVVQYRKANKFL
jgi:predicted metallopeptidase